MSTSWMRIVVMVLLVALPLAFIIWSASILSAVHRDQELIIEHQREIDVLHELADLSRALQYAAEAADANDSRTNEATWRTLDARFRRALSAAQQLDNDDLLVSATDDLTRLHAAAAMRLEGSAPHDASVEVSVYRRARDTLQDIARRKQSAISGLANRMADRSGGLGLFVAAACGLAGLVVLLLHRRSLDIQRLHAARLSWQESESLWRAVVNASFAGVAVNVDGEVVKANQAMADLFGYAGPEEMVGLKPEQICMPESVERAWNNIRTGNELPIEVTCRRKDGTHFDAEAIGRNILYRGLPARVTAFRDVTARKRAEKTLREQEHLYRALIDAMAEGVIMLNREGTVVACNGSAERILGISRDDAVGKHPCEPPCSMIDALGRTLSADQHPAMVALRTGQPQNDVIAGVARPDGGTMWLSINARPLLGPDDPKPYAVVASFTDVTVRRQEAAEDARQRERLEELVAERTRDLEASHAQLRNAERLASLGTLAAGVAHEINNPIGAIQLAAENALQLAEGPDGVSVTRRALRKIVENTRRCAQIVRGVLAFARDESGVTWSADLNALVCRCVELTSRTLQERGAVISTQLERNLPPIDVNAVAIEQVLVNLIQNAADSAPTGVHVSIETSRAPDGVACSVRDNGRGMTVEQQRRAFDPFYTTRQDRGGTGLGLSIAHGIIRRHGGRIAISSRVGSGTTVTFILPVPAARAQELTDAHSAGHR